MTPSEILDHRQRDRESKEQERARTPLPSSLLPIANRLRMFPIKDHRRAEADRPHYLKGLLKVFDWSMELGTETIPIKPLVDTLVFVYEGDDGLFYAQVFVGKGYYIADPHWCREEAEAHGWDLLDDLANSIT